MSNGTRLEQNNNEPNQHVGGVLYQNLSRREMADLDRGDIRVLEKEVHDQPYGDSENVQTTLEQTRAEQVETKRLFDIAKENGLFIDRETSISLATNFAPRLANARFSTMKKNLLFIR